MATGLLHKLHVIKSEFTDDPTGVSVDKTEILALVTEGKVPFAKPIILLNCAEVLLKVMDGVVAVAGYPGQDEGAE
jgi:hypothetical protein